MFGKILRSRNTSRPARHDPQREAPEPQPEEKSAALKIVHAGGTVECYFMAVHAKVILAKHPSCYLARPDVFRRPWESVVRPDQVLKPGEKYFAVPRHTVRKLCRVIRKPNNIEVGQGQSQVVIKISRDVSSSFSGMSRTRRAGGAKKHVRFIEMEKKLIRRSPSTINTEKEEVAHNNVVAKHVNSRRRLKVANQLNCRSRSKVRRSRIWQPSLASISERHWPNE